MLAIASVLFPFAKHSFNVQNFQNQRQHRDGKHYIKTSDQLNHPGTLNAEFPLMPNTSAYMYICIYIYSFCSPQIAKKSALPGPACRLLRISDSLKPPTQQQSKVHTHGRKWPSFSLKHPQILLCPQMVITVYKMNLNFFLVQKRIQISICLFSFQF